MMIKFKLPDKLVEFEPEIGLVLGSGWADAVSGWPNLRRLPRMKGT